MKIALSLTPCECETLFQLSINHPWRDARLRASGLLMLGKGEHATAVAKQCGVSHQSIYIDGRPRFAKPSIDDGRKVEIAAIDPDFDRGGCLCP